MIVRECQPSDGGEAWGSGRVNESGDRGALVVGVRGPETELETEESKALSAKWRRFAEALNHARGRIVQQEAGQFGERLATPFSVSTCTVPSSLRRPFS